MRKILKVKELTQEICSLLERRFSDLWVEGEISGLSRPRSGHLYFVLKDSQATIKGIIFQSHLRFLRFMPKEGAQVLIRGHLSLYAPRGEYQLICDYIEPKGAGALQAAFEALKEKLRLEGLFHPDRKQPIPLLPSNVGIITSASGAAIQDIIKVVQNGRFRCALLIYPVSVQGWAATEQITTALDELNQYGRDPAHRLDLLILARGGGSLEDLAPFNEEAVARAIARSEIPVISAVGHESDTTISDYTADLRAPTPSVAADMVVQQGVSFEENLLALQQRLIDQIKMEVETHKNRITDASRRLMPPTRQTQFLRDQASHLVVRLQQGMDRMMEEVQGHLNHLQQGLAYLGPTGRLNAHKTRIRELSSRLIQEGQRAIAHQKVRLQTEMEQLNLLSPLNILGRGYSITRKLPGLSVVRETTAVAVGDLLQVRLHRGDLICTVEEKSQPIAESVAEKGRG